MPRCPWCEYRVSPEDETCEGCGRALGFLASDSEQFGSHLPTEPHIWDDLPPRLRPVRPNLLLLWFAGMLLGAGLLIVWRDEPERAVGGYLNLASVTLVAGVIVGWGVSLRLADWLVRRWRRLHARSDGRGG
jgi:hypothetical protein